MKEIIFCRNCKKSNDITHIRENIKQKHINHIQFLLDAKYTDKGLRNVLTDYLEKLKE